MSLVHKLPENLNKNLIYQRISAGQAITFAWEKTTTPTRNLVHAYADSLGCPAEYILFPLLTVTASFIGTHGRIQINDSWEEPSIVWFNVCARKGQKKTAALNVLARPVREIEQDLQEDFKHDNPEAQDRDLPRLLVDHFSFEKLHQVMSQNNNKVLGAYDELTQFYNMLDHYKSNSTLVRKHCWPLMEERNGRGILKTVLRQWIQLVLTSPDSSSPLTLLNYCHKMTLMALMIDSFMCAL